MLRRDSLRLFFCFVGNARMSDFAPIAGGVILSNQNNVKHLNNKLYNISLRREIKLILYI